MNGRILNIYDENLPKYEGEIKKVSVIIPNYNYQQFIEERIDSILMQTYPIYELIILDDCSTDDSVSIIEKKIKKIKNVKIKLITNKKNSGCVFSQWQKGLKEASGDYFWIAEADDSADPMFLETVMKGFENPDVVLSYCDSARIDEKNVIIAENSQDLYNMFDSDRWNKKFIHSGKQEIEEVLSVTNTILNVSSVVWKMGNYDSIFQQASRFHVAGDWYIYYQLLKNGSLAFFPESLNYYRKHGSSVSTDVKADIEYQEICKIQEMANREYNLGMNIYKLQRRRRNYMDANVSKKIRKKKIAWVIPHPGKGSGGHRTIIQNVNALIRHGYECDIYVEEDWVSTDDDVANKIDSFYEICAANVYVGIKFRTDYDLLFATGWTTIDFVKMLDCPKKAYFIQDFEPWFFPMGDNYLITENSYRLGFYDFTIGKWLSHKMIEEYNSPSQYFDFCADLNIYHPLKGIKKENAICYIWQPEKSRRCDAIALKALHLVKIVKPNLKIYVYGSETKNKVDFDVEKLGIISIQECNELYNKCQLGLCMSASNPSRIPFEMMAAGLPVVEMYKENNLYDFPEDGICLAEPSPEAIATAILNLLDNPKELRKMGTAGYQFMKDYPLEKGFVQFTEAVDKLFLTDDIKCQKINKLYCKKPILSSKKIQELSLKTFKVNALIDTRNVSRKKITKAKFFIKRVIKTIGWKIIHISDKL